MLHGALVPKVPLLGPPWSKVALLWAPQSVHSLWGAPVAHKPVVLSEAPLGNWESPSVPKTAEYWPVVVKAAPTNYNMFLN